MYTTAATYRLLQRAAALGGLSDEQAQKLASLADSNVGAAPPHEAVVAANDAMRQRLQQDERRGAWTAATDKGNVGIGLVKADMKTMSFQYVRTATGEVFDSVELRK